MSTGRQWRQAVQLAAERQRESVHRFKHEWDGTAMPIGPNWRASLKVFIDKGLDIDDLIDLIPAAMLPAHVAPQDRWRYFCGCAWNRIRSIEDEAFGMIERGELRP